MQLSRESKLARFAYFGHFGPMPRQTSLCAFFWRAFVFIPLFWLWVAGITAMLCGGLGYLAWRARHYWDIALFVAGLIAVSVTCMHYEDEIIDWQERHPMFGLPKPMIAVAERRWTSVQQSFFWRGLKTLKGKVCPIIEIRD